MLPVPIPEGCGHLRARLSMTEEGPLTLGHSREEGGCRQDHMLSREDSVYLKSKPRPSTGADDPHKKSSLFLLYQLLEVETKLYDEQRKISTDAKEIS